MITRWLGRVSLRRSCRIQGAPPSAAAERVKAPATVGGRIARGASVVKTMAGLLSVRRVATSVSWGMSTSRDWGAER